MKKLIALTLASLTLFSTACGSMAAVDLMSGVTPQSDPAPLEAQSVDARTAVADFGVRLFRSTVSDENTLISPLSVLSALAMTANGAGGDTLSEMEAVLGLDTAALNEYMSAYLAALPEEEKCKLSLANSIWFTDDERFTVNKDFLQTNADYYGADIYKSRFDNSTVRDINTWVKDNTDGMIKKVLDEIPDSAVMYLVNALAFDAEWQSIYEDYQVRSGHFDREDGTSESVKLMHSSEHMYIEDENTTGFIKYYNRSKCAFVALLPSEGMTIADYIGTLTGEKLTALIDGASHTTVRAAIPKFSYDYSAELADILADMGMPTAFNADIADFSRLGTSTAGNIFISRVIHKTHIEVGERGTKAGAVTVIETADGAADITTEPKEVILDRPFVYAIIDCSSGLPLFIGTVMDV